MLCSHKETFLLQVYIVYQTITMLYMYVAACHLIGLIIVSGVCDHVISKYDEYPFRYDC